MKTIVDDSGYMWIEVAIDEGMFSSENAVIIRLSNGKSISLFADKGLLQEKNGDWYLRVRKIKTNHESQLVLLPIEAFETSTRWAEIPL
jgi:hypothetical protein